MVSSHRGWSRWSRTIETSLYANQAISRFTNANCEIWSEARERLKFCDRPFLPISSGEKGIDNQHQTFDFRKIICFCVHARVCVRAPSLHSNSPLCWRLTLSVTVSRFVLFIIIFVVVAFVHTLCASAKKNPLNLIGICFVIVIRCLHAPRCHMSYQFYIQITSCVCVYVYTTCVLMILTMRYSPFRSSLNAFVVVVVVTKILLVAVVTHLNGTYINAWN